MTRPTSALLCRIDAIADDASRGFDIAGTAVFAVKKDGRIYVYRNSCPHLGITLEWNEDQFLDADGALIQCSTHGALFIIESGKCVAGPCIGKALIPIAHRIEQGNVMIELPVPDEPLAT